MHVTSQTTVAAPIEAVWDKLSDHVGMSEWGPVTVTMDKLGAADPTVLGRFGVSRRPARVRTSSRRS